MNKPTISAFILHICLILLLPFYGIAQSNYTPKAGDLLLQDLDCGGLCDAIERVTPALAGKHFSHIGMVCTVNDTVYVIEAIGKDVHLTPYLSFLNRNKDAAQRPKIVVTRLKTAYQHLIQPATLFCLAQIGTPYDDVFLPNNAKYYCSELLYDAFTFANQKQAFFELQPMTFIDPATQQTFPAWTDYYRQLNQPIPEKTLGCNPGSIANSPFLTIIHQFY